MDRLPKTIRELRRLFGKNKYESAKPNIKPKISKRYNLVEIKNSDEFRKVLRDAMCGVSFEPDIEIANFLLKKAPFIIRRITANKENRKCDICGFLGKKVACIASTYYLDGDDIYLCLKQTCAPLILSRELWDNSLLQTYSLRGGLLANRTSGVDPVLTELMKQCEFWIEASGRRPEIIDSILKQFAINGSVSPKQRRVIEDFTVQCKSRVMEGRY